LPGAKRQTSPVPGRGRRLLSPRNS
jgi:hypothetical protein